MLHLRIIILSKRPQGNEMKLSKEYKTGVWAFFILSGLLYNMSDMTSRKDWMDKGTKGRSQLMIFNVAKFLSDTGN